jgi:predicted PurR-regulated permease PerM
LSLLLILLIALAVNPLISRLRALTGGRKMATGLVMAAFVLVIGLTGWAFIGPLRSTTAKITATLPSYLERLQRPVPKVGIQAGQSPANPQAKATAGIPPAAAAAGGPATAGLTAEPGAPSSTTEWGSSLSSLGQTLQSVASGFKSIALNASQIMVVLMTVFFGVTFTLLNPRPIFAAIFSMVPERHHPQTLIGTAG